MFTALTGRVHIGGLQAVTAVITLRRLRGVCAVCRVRKGSSQGLHGLKDATLATEEAAMYGWGIDWSMYGARRPVAARQRHIPGPAVLQLL